MRKFHKRFTIHYIFFLITAMCLPNIAMSQKTGDFSAASSVTYADILDLALASDAVAVVKIKKANRVADKRAPGLRIGSRRFLVNAEVSNLIRGGRALPQRITYLIDLTPGARGQFTQLAGGEAIVFGDRVAGFDSELRLVTPDAQLGATPARLQQVRSALAEANLPNAPGAFRSITGAYYLPGPIPGEGESQFFLETDQRPMSITVSRTPGAPPRWWIALGEVVDQGLEPPRRNSFLWYRLACFLPTSLPIEAKGDSDQVAQAALDADYKVIREGLGACPRTLNPRPGSDLIP